MAIEKNLFRAGVLSGGFWGVFTGFFSYLFLSLNRNDVTSYLNSSGTSGTEHVAFQTFAFVLVVALIIMGIMGGIIISIIFERTGHLFNNIGANKRGIILGFVFGLLFVFVYPFPGIINDIGDIAISITSGYFLSSFYRIFSKKILMQKKR